MKTEIWFFSFVYSFCLFFLFAIPRAVSQEVTITSPDAIFVKTDGITQGNWVGMYGNDGFNVIDEAIQYPAYVTVNSGTSPNYIWSPSTNQPRALQKVSQLDRIAACWYSPIDQISFVIDINVTDGNTHQFTLYALDWDSYAGARSETIQIVDPVTGNILDSESVNSFQNGIYLVWIIQGHVNVVITTNNPNSNCVISGLFFDPAPLYNTSKKGSVVVTWNQPFDTSDVYGYVLLVGTQSGVYTRSINVSNVAQTTGTICGLCQLTSYYIVVKSYGIAGDFSVQSNQVIYRFYLYDFAQVYSQTQNDGSVNLTILLLVGYPTITMWASNDLKVWAPIGTYTISSNPFVINDVGAIGQSKRFYKVSAVY